MANPRQELTLAALAQLSRIFVRLTMLTPLSEATEQRLEQLFHGDDRRAAREMLERDCEESIAGVPEMCSLDRIRLAVLKVSGGALDSLARAVALAQVDFRDALVAAGFADDVQAHLAWWPE